MPKKILTLILALVLVLSFAACGQKDVTGDVTPGTVEQTPDTNATEATETTEATEATEPEAEFGIGTVSANVYTNKFLGITCALDASSWVIKSDAEIREMNEQSLGMMGDDYAETLKNATVIFDFMAAHTNNYDSLNITMERLSLLNLAITENSYLEAAQESIVGSLSSMGIEGVTATIGTIQFAGSEHGCMDIHGTVNGIDMYEKLVILKRGNYIACITACTWFENTCDDILSQFNAI